MNSHHVGTILQSTCYSKQYRPKEMTWRLVFERIARLEASHQSCRCFKVLVKAIKGSQHAQYTMAFFPSVAYGSTLEHSRVRDGIAAVQSTHSGLWQRHYCAASRADLGVNCETMNVRSEQLYCNPESKRGIPLSSCGSLLGYGGC